MSRNPALRRRSFLMMAIGATVAPIASLADGAPSLHVMSDPSCGCCSVWVEILERDGFTVTRQPMRRAELARAKMARGIPTALASCHTADIGGYVIEGHVPAADIRRLLAERPDAIGLSVPGMPFGSPGMGPEDAREAYDVHLILRDGTSRAFTHYEAA